MKRLAVIGYPVSHSLSPQIFNSLSDKYGIYSHYSRVTGTSYEDVLNTLKLMNVNAYNITAPYKNQAYLTAQFTDENSKLVNGSNLIIENEEICGYNTDIIAIQSIIKEYCPDINSKILIIGGGATALTAYNALHQTGYNFVTAAVRNKKNIKSSHLSNLMNIIEYDEILTFKPYNVIINTIPESDYFQSEMFDNPDLTIIDAIYHNPFLNELNCRYISGKEWLIRQAVPAFEKIYGIVPDVKEIMQLLNDAKPLQNNIILTGFMASGKSTVGKILANNLNREFIDSDEEIEKIAGKPISAIFENEDEGEIYFRELENDVIREALTGQNRIISVGGGALKNYDLAEFIKANAYVIYLYANYESIKKRINHQKFTRPLATDGILEFLIKHREEDYFYYSDLIINNSNDLEETVKVLSYEINSTFPN